MHRTLRTIRTALRATSATLILAGAGCADSERAADGGPSDVPAPRDASIDACMPIDAHVLVDGDVPTDGEVPRDALVQHDGSIMLAAFPLDALVCRDDPFYADNEEDGGFFNGRCCTHPVCYAPEPGASCDSVELAQQSRRFEFTSGDCTCGTFEGPFAPPEIDAGRATEGDCCYLIALIGCTGRPLSTDRGDLVAPIVSSVEWIA